MKKWDVNIDGVTHTIQYKKGMKCTILVDGESYNVKSSNMFIQLVDYQIAFGDTICNLVAIGNKVDLAVNGTYLGSKEPYTPVKNVDSWIWVLVGISTLGGFFISGILGALIGIITSMFYIQLNLKKKIGAVIATFIGCTIVQILLLFVLFSLL